MELIVGHVYSAKRRLIIGICSMLNDRIIISKVRGLVQYDSPTVRVGRRFPRVTEEQFLKWAKEDVTTKMPVDRWREESDL